MNAQLQDAAEPSPLAVQCRVHKFGGSSLADAERIRHVAGLMLAADEDRQVVVCSAMQGMTNALIAMADAAAAGADWLGAWQAQRQRHRGAAAALLDAPQATQDRVEAVFAELADLLNLGGPAERIVAALALNA